MKNRIVSINTTTYEKMLTQNFQLHFLIEHRLVCTLTDNYNHLSNSASNLHYIQAAVWKNIITLYISMSHIEETKIYKKKNYL